MPHKNNSSALLIKGYLPVRVSLPSEDETFFFVKEHFASDKCTLFVANVPCVPGVSSRVLLQSLLGRFSSIERVTVIENPRTTTKNNEMASWTTSKTPSFLGPIYSQGKFAHVVFSSNKEMRKCLRELTRIMSKKSVGELPGLSLEGLEIQTLQDETKRQDDSMANGESDEDEEQQVDSNKKRIHIVADRYRASCKALSRESLLEECNAVMEQYEDEEEAQRRAREASKSEPDEEGFVTVTYSSKSIGSKRELEQGGRRKGSKRSRKKKDPNKGFTDFYRFQTKESRKNDLQDLRKRFEQDLAKVKKMKEERQYRPF